ncbi:MAG: MMPL family transporter, partial [Planctomycetaceae bacterium]
MFVLLGNAVTRHWKLVLGFWCLLFLAALGLHNSWYNRLGLTTRPIPTWDQVAQDGEFKFLPETMQSLVGERLLADAFPDDLLKSSVVIVVRRYQRQLDEEDYQFIREFLAPRLEEIRDKLIGDASLEVKTPDNRVVGPLLLSAEGEACIVVMPLKSEFLEWSNQPVIDRIEKLLEVELKGVVNSETGKPLVPPGLDLAMSGSATVGRDMLVAAKESAQATERWTVVLVVVLLALIYRAPLLALIPLLTVMVSVEISLALLVLCTQIPPEWIGGLRYNVFVGMEVYITVVVYGTGVDYCLFLIARYKEELDRGHGIPRALSEALSTVGAALTASAFTVICGIGMMVFAQFGKFREAGVSIALSTVVGFLAALTFTPALLRLMGRNAFWPFGRTERIDAHGDQGRGIRLINRLIPRNRFQIFWDYVANLVIRRPGRILLVSVLLMLPFATIGVTCYDYLSYGLLSELPATNRSVIGAKAVQEHFPAGYAGPLTILI